MQQQQELVKVLESVLAAELLSITLLPIIKEDLKAIILKVVIILLEIILQEEVENTKI
jgi:hypothetical protein